MVDTEHSINISLSKKRVLLFSQYFFGYESKIKEKMRELGAEVDLYDEMSVKTMFSRALLKISPAIFNRKTERYYCEILNKIKNNSYDFVLFIDCEMPTEKVLDLFRKKFKTAKFCLHMWDSVENLKGVESKFKYFDHITTFDRSDAHKYKLKLRPLFFADEYKIKNKVEYYEYDLTFIGTIHSDRYRILKKMFEQAQNLNLRIFFYPYLQSRFIYYYYKLTKREFRNTKINNFRFDKISSDEIAQITKLSKVVIDIQHPAQTGLTMRTLEMVGMKKKIITTNEDIIKYDFYNKNNIFIIGRENPYLNPLFIESPYEDIDSNIYNYYSIDRWCLDVLGECI